MHWHNPTVNRIWLFAVRSVPCTLWKRRDTGHLSTPKVSKDGATVHLSSSFTAANTFPLTSLNRLWQMCRSHPRSVQEIDSKARINPFLSYLFPTYTFNSIAVKIQQINFSPLLSPLCHFRIFLVALIKNLPLKYHWGHSACLDYSFV